jgi:5-(carboxyamino)imidazole ribonucleotide mutase
MSESQKLKVAVVMGSKSDLPIMQKAVDRLKSWGIDYHLEVVSAHRTPEKMIDFGKQARSNGISVIIAGAGGAAHLPGMLASTTTLPVIGVPIESSNSIAGIDSLLSIAQMPGGIPVATMAVNGAENAAILATRILSLQNEEIANKLNQFAKELEAKVADQNKTLG